MIQGYGRAQTFTHGQVSSWLWAGGAAIRRGHGRPVTALRCPSESDDMAGVLLAVSAITAATVVPAAVVAAAAAPPACTCAGFCAGKCSLPTPAGPPETLTVFRLTPANVTDLVNKDTGNAEGDAFFTLDEYPLRPKVYARLIRTAFTTR
jgi:hypothetical protein